MNKKGKNKKGKVPVPSPSQEEKVGDKTEDVGVIGDKGDLGKTSEIIENVEEKIESVKEDRVPEIVSEVVTTSVDTKDEETPKKPKRNRGKKKKGKEEEFDNNLEEGVIEIAGQPPVEDTKADTSEVEKESLDTAIVTPTARKKKNKKKNAEQKVEAPAVESEPAMPIPSGDTIKELEVTEIPIKPEIISPLQPTEQETKTSKKKNKKKKRNDSEKSDKEEISCTTAFQKLMEVTDEPSEAIPQENIEDNVISAEVAKEVPKEIPPQKCTFVKDAAITAEAMEAKPLIEIQPTPVPESKSKKKNKKDKKNIPKSDESIPFMDEPITEPSLPVETEKPTDSVIKEDVALDMTTTQKSEPLAEESSSKPKAKIAKPVEKKRKGKQDNQSSETKPQEIIATDEPKMEEQVQVILKTPDIKVREEGVTSNIVPDIPVVVPADITITPTSPDQLKGLTIEDFESLNIADKAMGKKRKKGPKIPKTPDVSFEILDSTVESDTKQMAADIVVETSKETPITSESVTSKEGQGDSTSNITEMPILVDKPIDSKPTIEPYMETAIKDHVLLTPEITEEKGILPPDTVLPEKAEDIQKFETKSSKKRKKSPKPPKKETMHETSETTPAPKTTEEYVSKPDVTREMGEKIDASNITRMYDIEISSIKADESEGSVCDTVPDISYPRASSQQLTDDNNNDTVIREIFPVREFIPDVPVQECKAPKAGTIGTQKEHNVSPSKEEKTDLKSKMMEVNQDMEELRLSIERSLAELTAIEKSEEAIETRFEESKIKTEKNITKVEDVDSMQKKNEHEKMIEISDVKKSATERPIEEKKSEIIQDSKLASEKQLFSLSAEQLVKDSVVQENIETIKTEPVKEPTPNIDIAVPEATKEEIKDLRPLLDTKIDPPAPVTIEEKPTETIIESESITITKQGDLKEIPIIPAPILPPEEKKAESLETQSKDIEIKPKEEGTQLDTPPVCPARKDHKNKHKKKKGKQDSQVTATQPAQSAQSTTTSQSTTQEKEEDKTDKKSERKGDAKETKEKGKQQASNMDAVQEKDLFSDMDYEPIENFEDALTSSIDDVNKTFEMIVSESQEQSNPKINIIAPDEEKSPVSPPKNLLGHPDIPAPSSRRDYKKEKNKIPNEMTAKVKIKDAMDVEKKQSKNTQTISKLKDFKDCRMSDNEDFVYKYSFRKVFLQTACHVCKKDLAGCRVACCYCNLVFYCGIKHKDEDWSQHQAFCFAVSTIGHLKDQKHIYGDAKNLTGHDYRLIRMQMIVSCEKVLKRRLVPWEQEALLYPRICAHVPCREWRQMKLTDCQGCGQISFCTEHPDHCPKSHARWCKSYNLYQKLVCYQQTKGRLEPKLPTKVMEEQYEIPEKINEVLASMYEEKIDMNDIQYAALTQLATAPLTAAYCHQLCRSKNITANGYKKSTFTIQVVGAELQFEADVLNKWEVFFLHLRPDLQELKVVLINYNLNPSNLPLELLGKIKLCENCRLKKRRVILNFQDKRTYADYKSSEDFVVPDIVCAFNPSIQRSSVYNGKDPWPSTVNVILKQKIPFIITAYTITELHKDCIRIKECSETGYSFISEPKYNNFASVRPDRNFITDDEMPLLFKNYCFAVICG